MGHRYQWSEFAAFIQTHVHKYSSAVFIHFSYILHAPFAPCDTCRLTYLSTYLTSSHARDKGDYSGSSVT